MKDKKSNVIEEMTKKCKNCGHSNFIHGGIFGDSNCLDCDDINKNVIIFNK